MSEAVQFIGPYANERDRELIKNLADGKYQELLDYDVYIKQADAALRITDDLAFTLAVRLIKAMIGRDLTFVANNIITSNRDSYDELCTFI